MKWGFPFSLSFFFWGLVGFLRNIEEKIISNKQRILWTNQKIFGEKVQKVAVAIPARNEAKVIKRTINSVLKIVPVKNCFVVSDGSQDSTAKIAAGCGCQVLELNETVGKAAALEKLIENFNLLNRFDFILFVDADTKLDKNYLRGALPVFENLKVVAVAGYAKNYWRKHKFFKLRYFVASYRIRLFFILQLFLMYPQTWLHTNTLSVIPGFVSMYRTSVLKKLKIAVPGLAIEDFNLAFQIHKQKLGVIYHHPKISATCIDPTNLRDYWGQVRLGILVLPKL